MNTSQTPTYLRPYANAAKQHGGGFSSLLWATPQTQRTRFQALTRIEDFTRRFVLDVGCGRADLLVHLVERDFTLRRYVGIEAVPQLVQAARAKRYPMASIVDEDFVTNPESMNIGADLVVFSGSLNTLDEGGFYNTLRQGFARTRGAVVFNFLSSAALAGLPYLHWRKTGDVMSFARTLTSDVEQLSDYIEGDCTMVMRRRHGEIQ